MACVSLLGVALAVCLLRPGETTGGLVTHGSLWMCSGCLPPVADPGPCVPPRHKSARVGLRGYRRYFANDSLIGRPVPCTRDDKICFRHNLVFDPYQDRCEPIGGGHHNRCDLTPNRTEMDSGSGRLIGVCKEYADPCKGYRMAYDGRCYRKEVVRDVICGCEAKPTRHFLGGVECRSRPQAKIKVSQPSRGCVIPDLRFPDSVRKRYWKNPSGDFQGFSTSQTAISSPKESLRLRCSSHQAKCFSEGRVSVAGFRGCFSLLRRGPCPRGHVVALDIEAAIQGRAEGTCVHERGGCPKGHKRMLFDRECHEDREIKIEAPGDIKRNQFGSYIVVSRLITTELYPILTNNSCVIKLIFISLDVFIAGGFSSPVLAPPCGADDMGGCKLYEVVHEPPQPEI